jgi:rhodanese-related sulfurtransferase
MMKHNPDFVRIVDEARAQIKEIQPPDLKRMLEAKEDFTLIDVREADEQAKGVIPTAVKLPRGILERDIEQVTADKDRKIVLYCGGGYRSALAAVNLQKMGYKNVISMDGGWRGWTELQQ